MKLKEFAHFAFKVILSIAAYKLAVGLINKFSPGTGATVDNYVFNPASALGIA